jgi:MYXO-CTERM domain-containing protein
VPRPLLFALPLGLALALAAPDAAAFCGTYVSSTEEAPENAASEVALVRQGLRTTLTVANDILGDTRDFAMLIPVPEILPEDAIHVVDPTVFDRLRGYSNPREVSYECADFAYESDSDTDADSDSDSDLDTGSDVEVEAQYIVGEYDISILSATQSGSLVDWLQANGYAVPDASERLLGEYIDGGAYFFAAQVREDAGIESGQTLSPLQFSYEAEPYGLPIRIGTLNSPGTQDLRIYAFSDYERGRTAIANYAEATLDHDCMWEPEGGEDVTAYYARQLDAAFAAKASASWITEYSWGNGDCDPCTGVIPDDNDVFTLGYEADYHKGVYYWFTRLRMRYAPQTATQDLVLYETNMHDTTQMRFIRYDEQLEDIFPICNVGMADDPGTCDETVEDEEDEDLDFDQDRGGTDGDALAEGCGCATPTSNGGAVAALIVAAAVTRRRRRG